MRKNFFLETKGALAVTFLMVFHSPPPAFDCRGKMPERRQRQEKKSEPGFSQNPNAEAEPTPPVGVGPTSATSALLAPLLPPPRPNPAVSSGPFFHQHPNSSINGNLYSQHSHQQGEQSGGVSSASNTIHHYGVAQLINAAAVCETESNGSVSAFAAVTANGNAQRFNGTHINGHYPYPPIARHGANLNYQSLDYYQHHQIQVQQQHHHQFYPHNGPQIRGQKGTEPRGDNIHLNYIVNGNPVPVTLRPVTSSSNLDVNSGAGLKQRDQGEISVRNQNQNKFKERPGNSTQKSQSNFILPPKQSSTAPTLEISVSVSHPVENGKSECDTRKLASSPVVNGAFTIHTTYPCGSEVLQNEEVEKEAQAVSLPRTANHKKKSTGLLEIGTQPAPCHLSCNGRKPEVIVTFTKPENNIDDTLDLSKLKYLSRLACEVPKLDLLDATSRPPEEDLQNHFTLRQTDSPAIVVTAINGKLVNSQQQMGVFSNMANGDGNSRTVKVKQELLERRTPEETGDEVLDLRKPTTEKQCGWCGKKPSVNTEGVASDFCSEVCFHLFRRDSFKKRSNCIWCAGISPQKNNPGTPGVIDETRFCSDECLAHYKVKLFCEETSAHLDHLKNYPVNGTDPVPATGDARPQPVNELITPDLWLKTQSEMKKGSLLRPSLELASPMPQTISSITTSPDTSSQSVQSQHSNSMSPPSQPSKAQQSHAKARQYVACPPINTVVNENGRRRANSPVERHQNNNIRDKSPSSRPTGPTQDYQPSPRKRGRNAPNSQYHGQNSKNYPRIDVQQVLPPQIPMNMSMMMIDGMPTYRVNSSYNSAHSSPRSSRKVIAPATIVSEKNQDFRGLMTGGKHHHGNRSHAQLPEHTLPPSMIMQQHANINGIGSAMMTHSGLHTGGLMMSGLSPRRQQSNTPNSMPMSMGMSRLGLPSMLLPSQVQMHQQPNENGLTRGCNSFLNGINGISGNYMSPNNKPMPIGTHLPDENVLSLHSLNSQQRSIPSSSSSPVSTRTSSTQTDPDQDVPKKASGCGNEIGVSRAVSFLPPVTILVPYPVAIPLPIPVPIFLPQHLNPNNVPQQQKEQLDEKKAGDGTVGIVTADNIFGSSSYTDEDRNEIECAVAKSLEECINFTNSNETKAEEEGEQAKEEKVEVGQNERVEMTVAKKDGEKGEIIDNENSEKSCENTADGNETGNETTKRDPEDFGESIGNSPTPSPQPQPQKPEDD